MELSLHEVLRYASYFSALLPLLMFFTGKQDFKNPIIRALILLFAAAAVSELAGYVLIKLTGKSYSVVDNCYTIVEFLLFSYVYYLVLPDKYKKLVYVGLIIFTIFFIVTTVFIQPFNKFQSWVLFAEGIIVLVYTLTCWGLIVNIDIFPEGGFFEKYMIWVCLAVLYYFLSNSITFLTISVDEASPEILKSVWKFHNYNNIAKNVLFAVGVYLAGREIVDDDDWKKENNVLKEKQGFY